MVFLIAILLGLVQGLCEFLPVSSSGHLFLVSKLTSGAVGEGYFGSFFTIMLHVATLIAVLFVYREQVLSILRHPIQKLHVGRFRPSGRPRPTRRCASRRHPILPP